jgi:hypothetical protein
LSFREGELARSIWSGVSLQFDRENRSQQV